MIKKDVEFIKDVEKIDEDQFAKATTVSRNSLKEINEKGVCSLDVCEKIYSYIYRKKYRLNSVKEEILSEKYKKILFHGSKKGLTNITRDGSREKCDFGNGFYLGENYKQALSFVVEHNNSCVYSFSFNGDDLKIYKFDCDLEWMLAVCYYRGTLDNYSDHEKVLKIIDKIKDADVIIAPIADNRMFYIMSQFAEGEINADVAIHSLSASKLGFQYIMKTDKAINSLVPIEKYYICREERDDCQIDLEKRAYEIDTKLRVAKRDFKDGLYIDEVFE
ncbi:MAG: DUF3990 domain-containing protein [Bacilli bacterium]|nr:DUF3990 domain-containing protein [Bacilli bacterium]